MEVTTAGGGGVSHGTTPATGTLLENAHLGGASHPHPRFSLHRAQRGHEKRPANPAAVAAIPDRIRRTVRLYRGSEPIVDLGVVSALAYHASRAEDVRVYRTGFEQVSLLPGEFVVSGLTVAEDLWARLYGVRAEGRAFEAFYERVRRSLRRLCEAGIAVAVQAVGPRGIRGTVWRVSFDAAHLPRLAPPPLWMPARPVFGYRASVPTGTPVTTVNACDEWAEAFAAYNPMEFTQAEARYDTHETGFEVDYMRWTRLVGRGAAGSRYASSGAWRPSEYAIRGLSVPCYFPWITFDIDRGGFPEDAFEAVREVLEDLDTAGARLSEIIVSYTGGRGFHIRIPAGMVGSPVFRSKETARRVLLSFAARVTQQAVDGCVFDPRQMLRLIGSRHDESGLYCTAFSGDEFMSLSSVWEATEACARAPQVPFNPDDPRLVMPSAGLCDVLATAATDAYTPRIPEYRKTRRKVAGEGMGSVKAAALQGCGEGEEWHAPVGGKVYIGRDKLLYVAGCCLAREHAPEVALALLHEVNERCSPPMSRREVELRFRSAMRTISKNQG